MTSPLAQLRHVLIVEDDAALRRTLARIVRQWGAQVSEAGSVAEATLLLAEHPNLLITDVALPDGDAFQLLELAVQSRPAPMSIAISGRGGRYSSRTRCFRPRTWSRSLGVPTRLDDVRPTVPIDTFRFRVLCKRSMCG